MSGYPGIAAAIGGLLLAGSVGVSTHPPDGGMRDSKAKRAGHGPQDLPRRASADPVRISIHRIGVHAPVTRLGLSRDRTLHTPRRWADTGWWKGGPQPGQRGPAVVVGHFDSRTGPAVFYRLGRLRRGDRVTIRRRDGALVYFVVRRLAHYSKSRFPTGAVYGPTSRAELRLITCSGSFDWSAGHYRSNTVVYATRSRRR